MIDATTFPIMFIFLLFFFIFTISILGTIFWIWMVIDCAKRNFKKDDDKIVWILIIVFAQIIGAIIYYFVVKNKH